MKEICLIGLTVFLIILTTVNFSFSENNDEKNNESEEEKNEQSEAEFNVIDSDVDSLDENDDKKQDDVREIEGDPSIQRKNKKNLTDKKYKIFTNEYDEIAEAEKLETNDFK